MPCQAVAVGVNPRLRMGPSHEPRRRRQNPRDVANSGYRLALSRSPVRSPHPTLPLPGVPPAARLRLASGSLACSTPGYMLSPPSRFRSTRVISRIPTHDVTNSTRDVTNSHPRDARVIPIRVPRRFSTADAVPGCSRGCQPTVTHGTFA
jgi:hypothetical protein